MNWRVEVDNPENKNLLIRTGHLWWSRYYVCERTKIVHAMYGFTTIYPYKRISPPIKNKKQAILLLKMME